MAKAKKKKDSAKWVVLSKLTDKLGLSEEYLHRLANEGKIPFLMDRASTRKFNMEQVQTELMLLAIEKTQQRVSGFAIPYPENIRLSESMA